ncbi:hypothetical protein BDV24DRAFT_169295 [Aspergillus arachidicola]|uniref:Rhodopsin domain-containing protein n=1 Tax=Aspergillus arachidicola TaxID=656916 RepID=A0A5N6XRK4_9EURO|nr:hypothetical protein BDV24DRAFT_169295 [Aspergillus arachidicola]
MFLDVCTLVLPLPAVSNLQLARKTKMYVIRVFSFGILVTAVTCARLRSFVTFGNSINTTWEYVPLYIWSAIEVQMGINGACLPPTRGLFRHLCLRVSLTRRSPSGSSSVTNPRSG